MKRYSIGWTKEEDALLAEAAENARRDMLPLSLAFGQVAAATGRKPNSVRNRYYAVRKSAGAAAFVPFTEEETMTLVKAVLLARTRGESVRACTLRLANGDTQRMLRYQNKYRAVLKSRPDRIADALSALEREGTPAMDPYRRPTPPPIPRTASAGGPETTVRMLVAALYDTLLELARRNSDAQTTLPGA